MIFNTTHRNDEDKKLIDELVGKAYTFWQAIRLGGTGSKRMIIDEVSPNLTSYLNAVDDLNYGSIELRPKGILVHFIKGLKNYTWPIPYYRLVIFKTDGFSIHSSGEFIRFRGNLTYRENKTFIDKLMDKNITFNQI
ncbi:hypothetical protein POV27_19145 [Aureisphaera galaxeae]|uniref:hypothetical protein n=1 Tax=Aureisphaera galaxeae TaxID=1538023 RepID=UPI0023507E8C|nr:hypothetical protein [Aureisphaera galaxeae]MDC8006177.1 hypothetical protein [Aureisphaera galaxeae]